MRSPALAMAGADYMECSINLEMWEEIPEHLLVEEKLQTPVVRTSTNDLVFKSENFAEQIIVMEKAVASTKTTTSKIEQDMEI
ncbi:hypothetical protein ACH5RR_012357 [Cinchona calisaya]|uniref:Uncharacterized protein n=1 Tax=Cinchona calisaya TaxID=153742 RepID=A0ABD3A7B3_9GENT